MEQLAQLEQFLLSALDSPWLLTIVLTVCIIDAILPPVPSETIVIAAAAFAASTGDVHTAVLIATVAAAGAWIGDNAVYRLGRAVGTERWRWMRAQRVVAAVAAARRGLEQRGTLVIFTARFIPMGRVAVDLAAGATGYGARRFALTSAGAVSVWAIYSVSIGAWFGQWLGQSPLLAATLGVVVAIVLGLAIDRMLRMRRSTHTATASSARAGLVTRPAGAPRPAKSSRDAPCGRSSTGEVVSCRS